MPENTTGINVLLHFSSSLEDFSKANEYYIISENMSSYAELLLDWASHGYSSEVDLFITRPILLFLCLSCLT